MTSRLFLLTGVAKQKPVQTVRQTFRLQIGPVQQVHPLAGVSLAFYRVRQERLQRDQLPLHAKGGSSQTSKHHEG